LIGGVPGERSIGGREVVEFVADPSDQPDSAKRVLKAIEGIASAGYHEEAAALLKEVPETVRERSEFRTFALHLAAARDADDLSERIERAVASDESSLDDETTSKRLDHARVLSVNGHYELAAATVRPLVESPNHISFREASLFLIRNAYLSEDHDSIRNLSDQLLNTASDQLDARSQIGRTLRRLGLDDRGLSYLQAVANRAPTSENVRDALGAALASGRVSESRETIETFIRVVEHPLREVEGRWQAAVERNDREITDLLLAPYERTYPARLAGRLGRARLAFREGDVEEGRSLLTEYLETVDYSPRAAERILEFLDSNDLPYETTRVVAPKLEETARTNQSRRYIGYAHYGLDENEQGRQMLERAVEGAPDPGEAATEIAEKLFDRGALEAAEAFGNLAVERAPDRPSARLFRGLARLAQGDAEAGRKDIDAGIGSTADRSSALTRAGRAALEGGHPDIAAGYLESLARTPNARQTGVLLPFRAALNTYVESGHAELGVKFLEDHFPRTAAGGGLDSLDVRPQLVGLYRNAGQTERAFEVYRRGITRTQIRDPNGGGLPIYLNNLAYIYSITNRRIDEGFDLVRRALVSSDRRQSSYIDTLGWLHYRRGELAKAETYIRRSLRTASSSPGGLVELYEHLAKLRDARGFEQEAFWLRRFNRSLERN
jgi:tetratricopeptide (TPR) repeat protein